MIRFDKVTKTYPRAAGATALRDVSFRLGKGEFAFLTGPSGAGKSTILKLLYMAERPTSGEVRISGYSSTKIKQREVGRTTPPARHRLQDFQLLEDLTAEANVAFALEVIGAPRATIPNKVARALTQVGLASKATGPAPRAFWRRATARCVCARARERSVRAHRDEPTGNLDERATRGIFQLLREINASGTAVLMATHDLELVRRLTIGASSSTTVSSSSIRPTRRASKLRSSDACISYCPDGVSSSSALECLSVTTIAFSLFAFGLFGLVALNIKNALTRVEERVEIRAFVAQGTAVEAIATAADEIAKYPQVAKVDVITQSQALERARSELGEFKDVFESEFLPASMDVKLKPGFRDPASVKAVAGQIQNLDFVDDIRYGEEWITQLYRLRNIAGVVGAALGIAFAVVAIIIIGATIRMAVLARSKEISIMRLVGATDAFIRRPFLIEGSLKGVLGGMLALVLTYLAMRTLEQYLHFETAFFDRRMAFVGVVFGALMGFMGSAVSVGRHLRRV
jgi:cell division protein FtsX/ABC-type ATPase involved in cell division